MIAQPPQWNVNHSKKDGKPKLIFASVGALVVLGLLLFVNRSGGLANPIGQNHAMKLTLTPVNNRAVAVTIAALYAPTIYLFPEDRNRPASVDEYLSETRLMDPNGNVHATSVTGATLNGLPLNGDEYYLERTSSVGTSTMTGRAAVNGVSDAPLYARVFDEGEYFRVTYGLFYPVSGYQIFRIKYNQNGNRKRNFEWKKLAFHEGDWEHVQVWVKKSDHSFVGLAVGQHGTEHYYSASSVTTESGRPVLYSAWNTHAFYLSEDNFDQYVFSPLVTSFIDSRIKWMKIVDTTDKDETNKEYTNAADFADTIKLTGADTVQVTNGNEGAFPWLAFHGRYGPPVTNSLGNPPNFGPSWLQNDLSGASMLSGVAQEIADDVDLDIEFFSANGPKGPGAQEWWSDKIPSEAPSRPNSLANSEKRLD